MLSGEYVVLRGAKALALPTKKGQWLEIFPNDKTFHRWRAFDNQENLWLDVGFSLNLQKIVYTNDYDKAKLLRKILLEIYVCNPELFKIPLDFKTFLEFHPEWGLGSSSTLINNLANWSKVDAFDLLKKTFGGSGYDVAVAKEKKALIYQLKANKPIWKTISFDKYFFESIYFVYLNQKQNSRQAIKYLGKKQISFEMIKNFNDITERLAATSNINEFRELLEFHENILSEILDFPTIKEQFFSDYPGTIKSLGAWGGDFILAVGNTKTPEYFKEKGYHQIFKYSDFIL